MDLQNRVEKLEQGPERGVCSHVYTIKTDGIVTHDPPARKVTSFTGNAVARMICPPADKFSFASLLARARPKRVIRLINRPCVESGVVGVAFTVKRLLQRTYGSAIVPLRARA